MSTKPYILKLINEGEHRLLDFKFEISDAHKIARSLSAFANTEGGRLLVGVKDNGAIAGVRSDEEYYMIDGAASLYCTPPVPFRVRSWKISGKTVLEVTIRKSEQKPHFAEYPAGKWAAYIRVHDKNFPANRVLLKVWEQEKVPQGTFVRFTESEKLLFSFLGHHGAITISKLIRITGLKRNQAEHILIRFISLRMIQMEFTEQHGILYRFNTTPEESPGWKPWTESD